MVDPVLDETGRGNIRELFTNLVGAAQEVRELLIVGGKLHEHTVRWDEFQVVVLQPLMTRDVADRTDARSADFSRPLGQIVGQRENLFGLRADPIRRRRRKIVHVSPNRL